MTTNSVTSDPFCWGPPADWACPGGGPLVARVLFDTVIRTTFLSTEPALDQLHRTLLNRVCDMLTLSMLLPGYLARVSAIAADPTCAVTSFRYPGSHGVEHTFTSPTIAWACMNAALDEAVNLGFVDLVQALLRVQQWRICPLTADKVLRAALFRSWSPPQRLVPVLVADTKRFPHAILRPVVKELVHQYDALDYQDRVHLLLSSPGFPPGLVWEYMLEAAMRTVEKDGQIGVDALPTVLRANCAVLVGDWQFNWAQNQVQTLNARIPPAVPVPPRLLETPCPRLLLDLPEDVWLQLHTLLDLAALRNLRLVCRALCGFPTDRFSFWWIASKLKEQQGTPQNCPPSRLSQVVESTGRTGPTALDSRALIEAARCLDVDLALKYLYPKPQEQAAGYQMDPHTHGYVLPWTLLTLLHTAHEDRLRLAKSVDRAGVLLHALLKHPHLPPMAWGLVLFFYETIRQALTAADLPTLNARLVDCFTVLPDPVAPVTAQSLMLDLLCTGSIPTTRSSDLTRLFGELSQLSSSSNSRALTDMQPLTRVFLILATVSFSPSTFGLVLPHICTAPPSDHTTPADAPTVLFPPTPLLQVLLTAIVTSSRSDPSQYLTHVLETTGAHANQGLVFQVAVHAVAHRNEDALDQLTPHIADCALLQSLVLPRLAPPATPTWAPDVRINALVLTWWSRRAALQLANMRAPGERILVSAGAGKPGARHRLDYMQLLRVEKQVAEHVQMLAAQTLIERSHARMQELKAAWAPVRELMDELAQEHQKPWDPKSKGEWGVNEGRCWLQ